MMLVLPFLAGRSAGGATGLLLALGKAVLVAVGMLVQVGFVREHPGLALGGVAVIMGGKTIAAAVGPSLMGYSGRVALLAGLAVSQIGEFSFVLAREGRAMALLSEQLYQTF